MCPLKLFPRRTATRAEQTAPRWVVFCLCLHPGSDFRIYFQLKVAAGSWCVSAQTWAQSRRERERDIETERQRGEREREERSPFPLSDAGRFEERTWGDAQARIFITRNNAQHMILRMNCQRALVEVRWSLCCCPCFCLLGMLRRTRQSNCLSEVCGEKDILRTLEKWQSDKYYFLNSCK